VPDAVLFHITVLLTYLYKTCGDSDFSE